MHGEGTHGSDEVGSGKGSTEQLCTELACCPSPLVASVSRTISEQ
jgi:hypothetical protein